MSALEIITMTERDALVMDVQIEAVWAFPGSMRAAIERPDYYPAPIVTEALWLRDARQADQKSKRQ